MKPERCCYRSAGWLDAYLDELSTFPSAAHDDYVDSTTHALNYMRKNNEPGILGYYREQAEKFKNPNANANPPRISQTSPPSGSISGGEVVTVTGNGLAGASVEIGGNMATIHSSTDTQIIFVAPPHAPGAVNVIVKTVGGSAASSGGYTYR